MARRMYDLDNGVEKIKVASLDTSKITSNGKDVLEYNDASGLTLSASEDASIKCYSPFEPSDYPTSARPSTSNLGEGAIIYDSTLKKCILYNGTDWVNLDGTALS